MTWSMLAVEKACHILLGKMLTRVDIKPPKALAS